MKLRDATCDISIKCIINHIIMSSMYCLIALGPIPRSQIYGSKVMHLFKTFLKSMLKISLLKKNISFEKKPFKAAPWIYLIYQFLYFRSNSIVTFSLSTHVSHCIVMCSFSCQHCYYICSCHEIKNYPKPRNMLYKFESPLYAVASFPWYRGNLWKH